MAISSQSDVSTGQTASNDPAMTTEQRTVSQLSRWGGIAGLAGVLSMIGTVAVVVGFGLPDADDPETLTDFADIQAARIAEHFLYLGAIVLFALHVFVLNRLLRRANPAAALFGTVVAAFGYVIMAASSVLHVSTWPLAELYTAPDTSPDDLRSIEYAWHAAQSVFDTMLATGLLLVPIGIVLLGIAMRSAPAFGSRLAWLSIGLGALGAIGTSAEIIDPGSDVSAIAILALTVFHLSVGWRTLTLANEEPIDLSSPPS